MSIDLFEHLRKTLEDSFPEARLGKAEALAKIANAHSTASHLSGYSELTYAWIRMACEAADATEKHREEKLDYEVIFSALELSEGDERIPEIRERLQSGETPGEWTGTIVPNDADFIRDWLKENESRMGKRDERRAWAHMLLFEHIQCRQNFQKSLAMVNALLAGHTTQWQLVILGCGPLEDMLKTFSDEAVDEFVPRLKTEPALAKAIACAWISEPGIRGYWDQRIKEHGVPVAIDTTGTMHLRGPHTPL